jgi:hypothetical protein
MAQPNSLETTVRRIAEELAARRREAMIDGEEIPLLHEGLAIKGKAFDSTTPYTADEQRLLKRLRLFHRRKAKQCYANSQRLVTRFFEFEYFEYAEGFITGGILHAWLLLNGKVVDVTLDRTTHDYFGIVIPRKWVIAHNLKTNAHGPLINDWNNNYEFQQRILGSRYGY